MREPLVKMVQYRASQAAAAPVNPLLSLLTERAVAAASSLKHPITEWVVRIWDTWLSVHGFPKGH